MNITRRLFTLLVLVAASIAGPGSAGAAEVAVAVAANFTAPAKDIAAQFHDATGNDALLSFGSSGEFMTQIEHGAPFDVLLSADSDRPQKAEQSGLAVSGTRFTYAIGRLALWSKQPGLVDPAGDVLKHGTFNKISIADPKVAPYGAAAVEAMQKLGVWDLLQPKLVQGTSIAQAQEFVKSGAADLGFVALSQIITDKSGSHWLVPQTLYSPINQDAVLLKRGAANPAAKAFLDFLHGSAAKVIIRGYGYIVYE
jgi:molybdate transport system substrate-binding protein